MMNIDVHTHGLGGYGTKGASPQDILKIAYLHGTHGVDAIIPTIYPAPVEQMRSDIWAVKKAMESQPEDSHGTAKILGVHLEGPFLNIARAGALDKNALLPARIELCRQLMEGFEDIVKIVTIAPELDGAPGLITFLRDSGINVNMGHSEATFSEAEAGFNAGALGITHIFNAMRGIHHREPGIAGFGLIHPRVFVEIIADPYHLHPGTLHLIFRIKKSDKIIIVSDSVKQTGICNSKSGIMDSSGRLQGGSQPITESSRRLVALGFSEHIVNACMTTNPAEYLAL